MSCDGLAEQMQTVLTDSDTSCTMEKVFARIRFTVVLVGMADEHQDFVAPLEVFFHKVELRDEVVVPHRIKGSKKNFHFTVFKICTRKNVVSKNQMILTTPLSAHFIKYLQADGMSKCSLWAKTAADFGRWDSEISSIKGYRLGRS
jgi:hypothetical protein